MAVNDDKLEARIRAIEERVARLEAELTSLREMIEDQATRRK